MAKRPRTAIEKPLLDLCHRELGQLSARNFAHRLGASEDLVLRLDVFTKLEKHRGCVNTVSFNADGDILVSGSDDRRVILWDWETGRIKLSFHSGHSNNVFQAKIMPHSDDQSIVTCAADGQVRHAQIHENGGLETKLLAKHQGRAHKLAIEPGSPHIFYTCGEDGLVQHFDLRTGIGTELFTCHPIKDRWNYVPVIHLNAIAIDPRNPNLFAVAGSDEYTRIYDIRKYKWDGSSDFGQPTNFFCPPHLIGDERVGITGLAFSEQRELLVSYNDEYIYLFTQDMGLGPNPVPGSPVSMSSDASETGGIYASAGSLANMGTDEENTPQVYKGHKNCETVKGVNFFGPKCEYVVSGSDCGRIFIWRKKDGELIRVMEADKHVVNCIESHPHTMVLASSGIEHDIKLWTPKAQEKATLPKNIKQDAAMGLVLSAATGRGWTTGSGMEGPSVPAVGSDNESGTSNISTFPWSLFTKSPRRRMLVAFTCTICGQRTTRAINPHAYTDGTVFVQCCGCNAYHKLVDHLNLFQETNCYLNSSFNFKGRGWDDLKFRYMDIDEDDEGNNDDTFPIS